MVVVVMMIVMMVMIMVDGIEIHACQSLKEN